MYVMSACQNVIVSRAVQVDKVARKAELHQWRHTELESVRHKVLWLPNVQEPNLQVRFRNWGINEHSEILLVLHISNPVACS